MSVAMFKRCLALKELAQGDREWFPKCRVGSPEATDLVAGEGNEGKNEAGDCPIIQKMRGRLRLLHHPISTERAYIGWVERFIRHVDDENSDRYGENEIAQFLMELAVTRQCHPADCAGSLGRASTIGQSLDINMEAMLVFGNRQCIIEATGNVLQITDFHDSFGHRTPVGDICSAEPFVFNAAIGDQLPSRMATLPTVPKHQAMWIAEPNLNCPKALPPSIWRSISYILKSWYSTTEKCRYIAIPNGSRRLQVESQPKFNTNGRAKVGLGTELANDSSGKPCGIFSRYEDQPKSRGRLKLQGTCPRGVRACHT